MTTRCRLIPLLVAVLVIQGLVGVLPHTHGHVEADAEVAGAKGGAVTALGTSDASHDCLACSIHAPVFENAGDRGLVHAVNEASPAHVIQWSISVLSLHKTGNPRAPPRIV